jgi:hypothetical protein
VVKIRRQAYEHLTRYGKYGETISDILDRVFNDTIRPIFYNQEILDPNTKQQRKLFERLEVGLLIRNTTYSYSYSYSYLFLQSMISL